MKLAVIFVISLVIACEAFSASHRHHTKKHHHQVRDGETTTGEIQTTGTTIQQQPIYHPPYGPGPVCLCEYVCPQPSTDTSITTTQPAETTNTSQKRRHVFHDKKKFNAHKKKHHSVRNGQGLSKKGLIYHPYWRCNCNNCVTLDNTTTSETETIITEDGTVTETVTESNRKKHHKVRAHHVKHH